MTIKKVRVGFMDAIEAGTARADKLIQPFRWYAVKLRQGEVDHELLTANQIDSLLDELDRYRYTVGCEVIFVRHGRQNSGICRTVEIRGTHENEDCSGW